MAYLSLLIFDLEENSVEINNKSIVALSWYQDLHKISKDDDELIEYLKYIYLALDPGSIYAEDTDIQRRMVKALENTTLSKEDVNREEVARALSEYEYYLSLNTELGLIDDFFTAINATRQYLREVDHHKLVESGARKGTPMYSPKDTFYMAERANKVLVSLSELKVRMGIEISKAQKKESVNNMKAARKPTFFSESMKK